ncbi:hypothetical protein D3C87_1497440 [compost metagenome]
MPNRLTSAGLAPTERMPSRCLSSIFSMVSEKSLPKVPVSVTKMAAMPASGPGPKPRVNTKAQISMSTERVKSKKRLVIQLAGRELVTLRAAMKASGNARAAANSVPTKAMTMVWISLLSTSPCCHSALVRNSVQASERLV